MSEFNLWPVLINGVADAVRIQGIITQALFTASWRKDRKGCNGSFMTPRLDGRIVAVILSSRGTNRDSCRDVQTPDQDIKSNRVRFVAYLSYERTAS